MPLDCGNIKREFSNSPDDERRIYVCEDGCIRMETRHRRQTFSAEEFVALLKGILLKEQESAKKHFLPVLLNANSRINFGSLLLIITCGIFFAGCMLQNRANGPGGQRIVSIGGNVTETIFVLGANEKLVGVDTSSIYPEAATEMPQVGYQRQLSSEGVLSLKPDLILAAAESGPPAAVQQIEAANVKIIKIDGENTIDGAKTKIREIAKVLDRETRGEDLVKKLDTDLSEAKVCTDSIKSKPKILFIYARGIGAPNVSGTKTAADAMINLAGGQNAVTGFENYKPLTPEALVAAQPDFILMPTLGLQSVGGIDGLLKVPGVAETPAGKNRRIITVDDLILLGFGPRLGEGVKDLCEKIR